MTKIKSGPSRASLRPTELRERRRRICSLTNRTSKTPLAAQRSKKTA